MVTFRDGLKRKLPVSDEKGNAGWLPLTGLSPFQEWTLQDGSVWARFYLNGLKYFIEFPSLAGFVISIDGLEISGYPHPQISEETVRHLYLNQVLPLALSLQGKRVFHASAIEVPLGAVAFLGESGRGKSTLAASFATNGYAFLTDDALVVKPVKGRYLVQPSHPSIRLWRDTHECLIGADAVLAPPVQYTPKSRLLSGEALTFCSEERQLLRMYFLGTGEVERVTFRRMTPAEAFFGLVSNSFLLDIKAPESLSAHFEQVAEMVDLPIYYRLDYPRSYDMLPAVRQGIIEHSEAEDS